MLTRTEAAQVFEALKGILGLERAQGLITEMLGALGNPNRHHGPEADLPDEDEDDAPARPRSVES